MLINQEIKEQADKAGIALMQRGNQFGTHAGDTDKLNTIISNAKRKYNMF